MLYSSILREKEYGKKISKLLDRDLLKAIILSEAFDGNQEKGESLSKDIESYLLLKNLPDLLSETPIFNYPDAKEADGDYLLGYIQGKGASYPFLLKEEEMIRHLLLVGSTGSGKTNLSFLLLLQSLEKGKPSLVIDWKRNYRDLINLPETIDKEILVFTVGRELCPFHFNPLIPPAGTSPHVWLSKMIEIMAHAYFLGEGVIHILTKAINAVYEEFGVYSASNQWPTFRDVYAFLEGYECKGRETQWLASALRSVAALCFGEMDRILNQGQYPLEEMLKKNVILEVDALTDTAKVFLTEALLLWIHHYRMAEGKREAFKHICVIEEAHHILSRKLQMLSGTETITDVLLREIREFGECLIVIDQDPSLLSIPSLGNTYTTVCMNLKEKNDVQVMTSTLNLSYKDKEILTKLEVGKAIVKLQGRFSDPFIINIPKVPVAKGSTTDSMLKERMSWFYEELEEIRLKNESFKKVRHDLPSIKEQNKELENYRNKQEQETIETITNEELTDNEQKLLINILKNRIQKVTDRYKELGINGYQGNKAQNGLLSKGLIKEIKLPGFAGKGYWGKTFDLSDKGRRILKQLGVTVKEDTLRKGGLEHKHLAQLIAEKLRKKGHTIKEEYSLGSGKATDLLIDNKIAIEIQRSTDNLLENIEKNIKAKLPVIIVAESQELAAKISKLKEQNRFGDSVKVVSASEFIENPELILFSFLPPSSQSVQSQPKISQ